MASIMSSLLNRQELHEKALNIDTFPPWDLEYLICERRELRELRRENEHKRSIFQTKYLTLPVFYSTLLYISNYILHDLNINEERKG